MRISSLSLFAIFLMSAEVTTTSVFAADAKQAEASTSPSDWKRPANLYRLAEADKADTAFCNRVLAHLNEPGGERIYTPRGLLLNGTIQILTGNSASVKWTVQDAGEELTSFPLNITAEGKTDVVYKYPAYLSGMPQYEYRSSPTPLAQDAHNVVATYKFFQLPELEGRPDLADAFSSEYSKFNADYDESDFMLLPDTKELVYLESNVRKRYAHIYAGRFTVGGDETGTAHVPMCHFVSKQPLPKGI